LVKWAAVEADLEALLAAEGYELVELQHVVGRGARLTLLADKSDAPGTIGLDDCALLSQKVGQYLDVHDPFRGPYQLQVSSPGVDRPLHKPAHFARAVGQQVRVKRTHEATTETLLGKLTAVTDDGPVLAVGDELVTVAWDTVVKAQVAYDWGD
jgi:ribosome maturation factor RimP